MGRRHVTKMSTTKCTLKIKAVDLVDKDWGDKDHSDPYFLVKSDGKEIFKSEVIKDNLNPDWGSVDFDLPADFEAVDGLEVILRDEDLAVDDNLGSVVLKYPIYPGEYELKPQGKLIIGNMSGQLTAKGLFGCFKKKEQEKTTMDKARNFFSETKAKFTKKEETSKLDDAKKTAAKLIEDGKDKLEHATKAVAEKVEETTKAVAEKVEEMKKKDGSDDHDND